MLSLNHCKTLFQTLTLHQNAVFLSQKSSSFLNEDSTKPYNILFLGSDNFAVSSLNRLKENADGKNAEENVVKHLEVVCPPRSDTAVRKYAKEHSLLVHKWPVTVQPNEFDVGVVVSFGKLLSSSFIERFRYGIINVHGSLLPAFRGAAPIARAIEMGCKSTGVTIMKIAPGKFDHGLILDKSCEIPIDVKASAHVVSEVLADVGADLCVKTLQSLRSKLSAATVQDEAGLSIEKLKGGIFDDLRVRQLIRDPEFEKSMTELELEAWKAFVLVVNNFLGNNKTSNYEELKAGRRQF